MRINRIIEWDLVWICERQWENFVLLLNAAVKQVHPGQSKGSDATDTGSEITGCTCADVAVGELKYFR